MSRVIVGLAVAVGLAAGAALGQVAGKADTVPGAPPDREARARTAVDGMFGRYDKNGDGVIDKDEMASTPSPLRTADRNGDGKITREELMAFVTGASRRGGGPPGASLPPFQTAPGGSPEGARSRPEPADRQVPEGPGPRSGPAGRTVPGDPGVRPEPGGRSASLGLGLPGSRFGTTPPRAPSEPPDPRAAMVTIRTVLVEVAPDAAGKTPEEKPDLAAGGKSELGAIDLDLAASPEAILAELRKLGVRGRLEVLNRMQMSTLDRQPAYVQFGRQEPFILGTTVTAFGQTNNVTLIPFGLQVSVEPRVASGDAVVLEIDLGQSRPGRLEEGTPIFVSGKGETIRQPSILQTQLRSTVKVPAGKTVVVVAASESGRRRSETLLLVSARVLKGN